MTEFANAYEAAWDVLRFTLSEDGIRWWCGRPSFLLADQTPDAVFAVEGEDPVRDAAHALATGLDCDARLERKIEDILVREIGCAEGVLVGQLVALVKSRS